HLEDRAFMEPPAMSLVASAFGVSAAVYAINVALAEPARAEYRASTPVAPAETGAGIVAAGAGELPEPENHGGGASGPAYHPTGAGAARFGSDAANPLAEMPGDSLTSDLEPAVASDPALGQPLDPAVSPSEGGGSGAEPGGHGGSSGGTYAGS